MDPQQALNDFFAALDTYDSDAALEIACNLQDWIARGGFIPTLTPGQFVKLITDAALNLRNEDLTLED